MVSKAWLPAFMGLGSSAKTLVKGNQNGRHDLVHCF